MTGDLAGCGNTVVCQVEFDWGGFLRCQGEGVSGRITSVIAVAVPSFGFSPGFVHGENRLAPGDVDLLAILG